MKTYIKPTVDVVELSVKENLANLPKALNGTRDTTTIGTYTSVPTTVYNLAAVTTSVVATPGA